MMQLHGVEFDHGPNSIARNNLRIFCLCFGISPFHCTYK